MTVTGRLEGLTHDVRLAELDDAKLLDLTRQGNDQAYAALYGRYEYAGRRLALHLGQREEADDVVSDAFAQILDLLQRGKGPDRAFRAYLFTTIRHESGRRAKATQRVQPTDDDARIDTAVPFGGGDLDGFEKTAIRAAYESLPERWRTVLWHLDVEGRKPQEIAPLMGLKPNSVSALVYRARSGLREAYLQQHVKSDDGSLRGTCQDVRGLMAAVVRRTASTREQEKVHAHLGTCRECVAVYLDLKDVNREVGAIVAPAAFAVAVGGAGMAVAKASGGLALAQLATSIKGLFIAASAPLAATALTTATVVGAATVVETPAVADDVATNTPTAQQHRPVAEPTDVRPVADHRRAPVPTKDAASTGSRPVRPHQTAPAAEPAPTPVPAEVSARPDEVEVKAHAKVLEPVHDLVDTTVSGVTKAVGLD